MRIFSSTSRFAWYFSALLTSILFIVTIMLILHFLVDPFGIYESRNYEGVNALKPFVAQHSRVIKPLIVSRVKPEAVILGSSTAEVGYDPDVLEANGYSEAYNFAIGGSEFYEIFRNFQHLVSVANPKLIIVSLDFIMWAGSSGRSYSSKNFYEEFLSVSVFNKQQRDWQNNWYWLFGKERLSRGLLTLHYQDDSHIETKIFPNNLLRDNGQRHHASYLHYLDRYGDFRKPFEIQIKKKISFLNSIDKADYTGGKNPLGANYLVLIREMVAIAKKKEISLIFNFPPCHFTALEIYRVCGVWDMFWSWKRKLANFIKSCRKSGGNYSGILMFDFSVYDKLLSEPIFTNVNQSKPLLTFADSFHFYDYLGDISMEYMLGIRYSRKGFGAELLNQSEFKGYYLNQEEEYRQLKLKNKDEFSHFMKIYGTNK